MRGRILREPEQDWPSGVVGVILVDWQSEVHPVSSVHHFPEPNFFGELCINMLNRKKKIQMTDILKIFEQSNECDVAFRVLSGVPEVQDKCG